MLSSGQLRSILKKKRIFHDRNLAEIERFTTQNVNKMGGTLFWFGDFLITQRYRYRYFQKLIKEYSRRCSVILTSPTPSSMVEDCHQVRLSMMFMSVMCEGVYIPQMQRWHDSNCFAPVCTQKSLGIPSSPQVLVASRSSPLSWNAAFSNSGKQRWKQTIIKN